MHVANAGQEAQSAESLSPAQWKKIEDQFRRWSFRIYYDRSFATETDPTVRFGKALIASSQPIRDRQAVLEWHRQHRHGRKSKSAGAAVSHV